MATENSEVVTQKHYCELCNYSTSRSDNYAKHVLTAKHKKVVNINKNVGESSYSCEDCRKKYKSRTGLWRHKKKCSLKEEENTMILSRPNIVNDLIIELIKQNGELITRNGELQKQLLEISNVA